VLGAAAAFGFFVSTPYAFFDHYYFSRVQAVAQAFSSSPWTNADLFRWLTSLWEYLGAPLALLALASLLAVGLRWWRGRQGRTAVLAAVLSLSVVLWYSVLVRLWVCVPYLLTGLAVLWVLIATLVARALMGLQRCGRWGHWLAIATTVGLLIIMVCDRGIELGKFVACQHQRDKVPAEMINRWAEAHLPHDAQILFDTAGYFDPAIFPNARLHNGLITYEALAQKRPQYFVLTSAIYDSAHYVELRQTQQFTRGHEGPYSVLLYQDLLDRAGAPEVAAVKIFRGEKVPGGSRVSQFLALIRGELGWESFTLGSSEVRLFRYLPAASRAN
jgi:hypothetical protein